MYKGIICDVCGNTISEPMAVYGDNITEPLEIVYMCSVCGTRYIDTNGSDIEVIPYKEDDK